LFSLEGVDEHAAAAVFVWNQCGPCEIKARGPGGDSKKRPCQDLRIAVPQKIRVGSCASDEIGF
jgi:hypothetical protein